MPILIFIGGWFIVLLPALFMRSWWWTLGWSVVVAIGAAILVGALGGEVTAAAIIARFVTNLAVGSLVWWLMGGRPRRFNKSAPRGPLSLSNEEGPPP